MLRKRVDLKPARYGCLDHLFQRILRVAAELARMAMVRERHLGCLVGQPIQTQGEVNFESNSRGAVANLSHYQCHRYLGDSRLRDADGNEPISGLRFLLALYTRMDLSSGFWNKNLIQLHNHDDFLR